MNEKPKHGCSYASFSLLFALLSFLFLPAIINAQTVTGKVADESGKSLGSVSVVVKGSSTGTITDASGQYTITAAPNATLLFSSIGFLNYEVSVAGRSIINVTLTSNEKSLNEVVITALGIRKQQRGLGYSATNVNPQELNNSIRVCFLIPSGGIRPHSGFFHLKLNITLIMEQPAN